MTTWDTDQSQKRNGAANRSKYCGLITYTNVSIYLSIAVVVKFLERKKERRKDTEIYNLLFTYILIYKNMYCYEPDMQDIAGEAEMNS